MNIPQIINIMPINDDQEHIQCLCCNCIPEVTIHDQCIIISHNSFDGREALEAANEILNKL